MVFGSQAFLLAGPPPIDVKLSIIRGDYFTYRQPVPGTINITNRSSKSFLISKGFGTQRLVMRMRVIDPAGRLLIPSIAKPSSEAPDAPPLPVVEDADGKLIQAAPCETFPSMGHIQQKIRDIGHVYNMALAGYYSLQVQLPVTIFSGHICKARDLQWSGVLKSKTHYIFMEGNTPIHITPEKWELSWKKNPNRSVVEVQIKIPKGKTWRDYNLKSIRLNNQNGKIERLPNMLKANFLARDCIESLGQVEPGRAYPVLVTGRFKNGKLFGGGKKVTVIR